MAIIIHNPSFDRKIHCSDAESLLKRSIEKGISDNMILVVPTGRLTRFVKFNYITKYFDANHKPCGNINVLTLAKFCEQCFKLVQPENKFRLLSDAYRMALIEEAMQTEGLEFYDFKGKKINYFVLERIFNIINGLREDGISADSMLSELESSDSYESFIKDAKKFSDIYKILKKYEELLEPTYLDIPGMFNEVNQMSNKFNFENLNIKKSIFDDALNLNPPKEQILLYGFSEFKNPEIEFLSKFGTSTIPLAVHLDFSEINGPLFGNLKEMKETLLTAGFDFYYTDDEPQHSDYNIPEHDLNKNIKYFLRRWLFNTDREIKFDGLNKLLKIFEFDTPENEVRQISKLVKHLIMDCGYQTNEIAIVSRDTERYSELFREALASEHIPANFSERFSLAGSNVSAAIISLLETIEYGFRRKDVIKSLQNLFIKIKKPSGNEINLSNLLQCIKLLRFPQNSFRLSKEFWTKRFTSSIEILNLNLQNIHAENEYGIDKKIMERKLDSFKLALEDFYAFASNLPDRKANYSPEEFKFLIVDGIINNFKIDESIKNYFNEIQSNEYTEFELKEQIENVEKFAKALTEFLRILEEMTFILKDRSSRRYKLSELIEKLKLSVSAAKYQVRENNYGVTITAVEQIREIPFKVTIFCGLNDGIFPLSYRPESFLGKELEETRLRHLQSEQIQFFRFLINGLDEYENDGKRIYISYSKFIDDYETSGSTFLDSLLKITNLKTEENFINFLEKKNNEIFKNANPWADSLSRRDEIAASVGKYYFSEEQNQTGEDSVLPINNNNYEIKSILEYCRNSSLRSSLKEDLELQNLDLNSKEIIEKMKEEAFSATDFETYASCGFKYFTKKLLRIEESTEESKLINSLEFGNILHSALFKFFTYLQSISEDNWIIPKESGENINKLKPVNILSFENRRNELVLKLNELINQEFEDISFNHPFIHIAKSEILGSEQIKGLSEIFIDAEINRQKNIQTFPVLFELEFGTNRNSKLPPIEIAGNIKLKGKIDRIDIKQEENSETPFSFITADYKTSANSVRTDNDIKNGISFQMPLYSLAIQKILNNCYGVNAKLHKAGYYILNPKFNSHNPAKENKSIFDYYVLGSNKENARNKLSQDQMLQLTLEHAEKIIRNISNGTFKVEPMSAESCKYCTFQPICRINERAAMIGEESENEE